MSDYAVIKDNPDYPHPLASQVNLFGNVWRRFLRHKGAIGGLIVFGILIALTVFAFVSP